MPYAPKLVKQKLKENRPSGWQRYSKDWPKTRRLVLLEEIFCACGCGAFATVVHHVNGNRLDDSRDNLRAMALSCHSKLHRGNT